MNRNAAMKQKCKEELLLWESEPMPDLTQESETDQCEFLAQQHPGKFPTFQILVACYVGGSRGRIQKRGTGSKCKNSAGVKKPDWKAALLSS